MNEQPRDRAAGGTAILAMMAASLLSMFDRSTMPPMLTAMASGLNTTIVQIGVALSVFSITYAVSQLLWSLVSARLGQVRVLRIALAFAVVGAGVTALAADPIGLWVGRMIAGIATGAIVPSTLVYVGDTVPAGRRTHVLANLATASSLGMTIAVIVASVLGSVGAWRWVFAITAFAEVLVFVLMLRVPAGARPVTPVPFVASLRRILTDRWAILVFALVATEGAMIFGIMSFLPTALEHTGTDALFAGIVTGVYGLSLIVTSQLMKSAFGRIAPAVFLAVGGGGIVIGFALLALHLSLTTVLIASAIFGAGWAIAHTQVQFWLTDVVSRDRPVGTALFATSLFTGGAIGAAVGSAVAVGGSFSALFAVTAAVAAVFAVIATVTRARYAARAD